MRDFKMPTIDPQEEDTTYASKMIQNVLEGRNLPYKCVHNWKTVDMIFSRATYCENCGERK